MMSSIFQFFLLSFFVLIASSCAGPSNHTYKQAPVFSATEFFNGNLCAWGVLYNRSGNLERKFTASIDAKSSDKMFSLDENFVFDDGEKQHRLWQFKKMKGQLSKYNTPLWIGTAADVKGQAIASFAGDSMFLDYVLKIEREADSPLEIDMSDQLHLITPNLLIGTTQMEWWGFDAGAINLVIQKQQEDVKNCNIEAKPDGIHSLR